MEQKLPVYNIVFDPDKPEQGLEFVSLVADPAIMEKGLAFNKSMKFAVDRDKQVIIGPAMIPDLPLYRNMEGKEFYVVFTQPVIDQLFEKFMKAPRAYKVNVDHDRVVESAFIKSAWIIEDDTHDKSVKYGFSLPVGTLMLEVKIEDSDFWMNEVKDAGKFGFSVEGLFDLQLAGHFSTQQKFVIPTAGESEDEFIGRCIPVLINEGKDQDQAIAICYSYWQGEYNKQNPKTNPTEMKEKFNAKVLLSELTPEEVEILKEAIAEAAPEAAAEIIEEVTDAVEETVNELMPEEAEVAAPQEVAPAVSEDAIKAVVEPMMAGLLAQVEELMTQVAELKSAQTGGETEVAMASHIVSRAEFIRQYNEKYNG